MSNEKSSNSNECQICCSAFTKAKRIPFACPECNFIVCTECMRKYLLTIVDAHCMNHVCKKQFSREFLYTKFSKSFVNEKLAYHHAEIAFQLEKSLLEETANYLQQNKKEEEIRRKEREIEDITRRIESLRTWYRAAVSKNSYSQTVDQNATLEHQIKAYIDAIPKSQYHVNIHTVLSTFLTNFRSYDGTQAYLAIEYVASQSEIHIQQIIADTEEIKDKYKIKTSKRCFTPKCPGFLTEREEMKEYTLGKCLSCKNLYCIDCALLLTEKAQTAHKCNPDTVKTLKLIARQARPCPNCKEAISKIDGCDQMFCTSCHTAFDWTSNNILTGHIHNPHYTEYLTKKKKEEIKEEKYNQTYFSNFSEEKCRYDYVFSADGGTELNLALEYISDNIICPETSQYMYLNNFNTYIHEFWNLCSHMFASEMSDLRLAPKMERYRYMRINFLVGRWDEKLWKHYLISNYKTDEIANVKFTIMEAFLMASSAIIVDLVKSIVAHQLREQTIEQLLESCNEVHKRIIDSCKTFSSQNRRFCENLQHRTYQKIVFPVEDIDKNKEQHGFLFDLDVGYPSKNEVDITFTNVSEIDDTKIDLTEDERAAKVYHTYIEKRAKCIEEHHAAIKDLFYQRNYEKLETSTIRKYICNYLGELVQAVTELYNDEQSLKSVEDFVVFLTRASAQKLRKGILTQFSDSCTKLKYNAKTKFVLCIFYLMEMDEPQVSVAERTSLFTHTLEDLACMQKRFEKMELSTDTVKACIEYTLEEKKKLEDAEYQVHPVLEAYYERKKIGEWTFRYPRWLRFVLSPNGYKACYSTNARQNNPTTEVSLYTFPELASTKLARYFINEESVELFDFTWLAWLVQIEEEKNEAIAKYMFIEAGLHYKHQMVRPGFRHDSYYHEKSMIYRNFPMFDRINVTISNIILKKLFEQAIRLDVKLETPEEKIKNIVQQEYGYIWKEGKKVDVGDVDIFVKRLMK